ncbi:PREDICTED: uncharacterized protein LOC109155763 [Ipomoea nil]|uniref:uncharacterized protein LOC109155763 n=1 Tax=Ipomoea nil TaxID=35883 RepID=UPI0009013D9E|nr:PREDICTED: uncharacterized protein LOC109155763 [Ipomoea nil]
MNDILKRAGMAECKPLSTPIPVSKSVPFSADLYDDPTQYQSHARALKYLTITRPYLSFAVNQLCQHMHAPTDGRPEDRKFTSGYVVFLGSNLVSWICIPIPKLWCDNLGATYMCANTIFHARTKHVEIDYHFVRDRVASGDIQVNFISTKDQQTSLQKLYLSLDFPFLETSYRFPLYPT